MKCTVCHTSSFGTLRNITQCACPILFVWRWRPGMPCQFFCAPRSSGQAMSVIFFLRCVSHGEIAHEPMHSRIGGCIKQILILLQNAIIHRYRWTHLRLENTWRNGFCSATLMRAVVAFAWNYHCFTKTFTAHGTGTAGKIQSIHY